jgi:hypothetical protein
VYRLADFLLPQRDVKVFERDLPYLIGGLKKKVSVEYRGVLNLSTPKGATKYLISID